MKIEILYKYCEEELQNFIFEYGETTTWYYVKKKDS